MDWPITCPASLSVDTLPLESPFFPLKFPVVVSGQIVFCTHGVSGECISCLSSPFKQGMSRWRYNLECLEPINSMSCVSRQEGESMRVVRERASEWTSKSLYLSTYYSITYGCLRIISFLSSQKPSIIVTIRIITL